MEDSILHPAPQDSFCLDKSSNYLNKRQRQSYTEKVYQNILLHPVQREYLDTSYNLAVADMQKAVPDCYTAVAFVGTNRTELIEAWAKAFVGKQLLAPEEDTDSAWDDQIVADKAWKDKKSKAVAFQKTQVHHS